MRLQLHKSAVILLFLILIIPSTSFAQDDDDPFVLRVNRDFGYGVGNQIQGRFSMRASGPDDLVRVEFLVDGEVVDEDRESPFRYNFNTDDFSPGVHELSALGYTRNGAVLPSITYSYEFLTAAESRTGLGKLVVPLLAIIGAISVMALLGPMILGRKKGSFRLGEYGSAGGAVCPRCTFPYPRHLLSPNLVLGKLERCPHCGKVALVGRASPADLEAAERRLEEDHDHGRRPIERDEERELNRLLEESRFED